MAFNPIDLVLHLDKYFGMLVGTFGPLIYGVLFVVVFCETGLVFTPYLPGDSLLFVAGTFAAKGVLSIWLLYGIFCGAAILGDTANYWIGHEFGERILKKTKFVKKEDLVKTKEFYKKYGGKTIIYARFIPIIRTFAPFVAGIGKMEYKRFLLFNVIGGIAWATLFLFAGFLFGNIPFVRDNLTPIILGIIFISLIPPVLEAVKARLKK